MATRAKATPTEQSLRVNLQALYEELISLNKVRSQGKPKDIEKREKRIAQLNVETRDIEHALATKTVDKK
jgi:hypothetical protein